MHIERCGQYSILAPNGKCESEKKIVWCFADYVNAKVNFQIYVVIKITVHNIHVILFSYWGNILTAWIRIITNSTYLRTGKEHPSENPFVPWESNRSRLVWTDLNVFNVQRVYVPTADFRVNDLITHCDSAVSVRP